eukprot:scaffold846_cov336-Pavlova_lutheri.AAC.3
MVYTQGRGITSSTIGGNPGSGVEGRQPSLQDRRGRRGETDDPQLRMWSVDEDMKRHEQRRLRTNG